jgi:hypothetical protein
MIILLMLPALFMFRKNEKRNDENSELKLSTALVSLQADESLKGAK